MFSVCLSHHNKRLHTYNGSLFLRGWQMLWVDAGGTDAAAAETDCSSASHVVQVQLQVPCQCTQHYERVWWRWLILITCQWLRSVFYFNTQQPGSVVRRWTSVFDETVVAITTLGLDILLLVLDCFPSGNTELTGLKCQSLFEKKIL